MKTLDMKPFQLISLLVIWTLGVLLVNHVITENITFLNFK